VLDAWVILPPHAGQEAGKEADRIEHRGDDADQNQRRRHGDCYSTSVKIGLEWFGGGLGQTGGLQVYARALVRALTDHPPAGHELVLVGGSIAAPRRSSGALALASARRLALGRSPSDAVGRALDDLQLDVLHYPATRIRELGLRTPVVLTFFDMQEEFLPRLFPWRERWGRQLSHRASVAEARIVIAPSRFTAESLISRYGTPAAKIVPVPAGVSDDFHADADLADAAVVGARGLDPGEYLFYPAHVWPHKNHARLFAALRLVKERTGRRRPLVCTGTLAGETSPVPALAAAAGLANADVRDLGFVDAAEMPALYRSARALVFPSRFEGFGMPVLEAMASGCPVAAADATALPELAGGAARLFDPEDTAAMAAAVTAVSDDKALRGELRQRGIARAAEFRWERLVPRLVEAYERAATSPP
jgi:glycosyltransferase involved in cell wall biosynthesis